MNRFPLWRYLLLAFALVVGLLYTLPNFYGEAPAVQVSSGKATLKLEAAVVTRIEAALSAAGVKADFVQFEGNSAKARFADTDTQIRAKDAIAKALNPDPGDPSYIVALNLLSRSPGWLTRLHALPMYLGLDLRGGVYFLMQVDMRAALSKKAESYAGDLRSLLRDKDIRHAGIVRDGETITVRFRDAALLAQARTLLTDQVPDLQWVEGSEGGELKLTGALRPEAMRRVQDQALQQNITTLHN
ncbi:MAG TPA: protein translocase subunit SecD, partial [Burkholderiaceae bacterium]|nr:protein translocase subunit SecD [Burkholderiaceae bacterium]